MAESASELWRRRAAPGVTLRAGLDVVAGFAFDDAPRASSAMNEPVYRAAIQTARTASALPTYPSPPEPRHAWGTDDGERQGRSSRRSVNA